MAPGRPAGLVGLTLRPLAYADLSRSKDQQTGSRYEMGPCEQLNDEDALRLVGATGR